MTANRTLISRDSPLSPRVPFSRENFIKVHPPAMAVYSPLSHICHGRRMQPPLGLSVMLATHLACIRMYLKPALTGPSTCLEHFWNCLSPRVPATSQRPSCSWALTCEALPGSGFMYAVAVSVPSTEDRWDTGYWQGWAVGGHWWWWSLLEGDTLTSLPASQVCELV
jgi:hypothetical protein